LRTLFDIHCSDTSIYLLFICHFLYILKFNYMHKFTKI